MRHTDHDTPEMSKETQVLVGVAREAVAQAIERHRRLGESIVVWRDGQVVIVPPEEIPPYIAPATEVAAGGPAASSPPAGTGDQRVKC